MEATPQNDRRPAAKPAAAQPREKASTKPPNYVPHYQVQYHVQRSTSRLASFEVTTGGYAFITGKPLGKPAGPRGCAPSEMKNGPSLVPAHEIVRVVGSVTAPSPQIACNLEAQAQIAQTEVLSCLLRNRHCNLVPEPLFRRFTVRFGEISCIRESHLCLSYMGSKHDCRINKNEEQ
ncbi:hypothetical protein H4582DRAFT_145243 [Lactarius indigo]|nr:hypothetical protein H4582DRAFT_145243 [Lactarius indigo]